MKSTLFTFLFIGIVFIGGAQNMEIHSYQPDSSKETLLVEASCGQCQFGMSGSGCTLAIRIDGKAYFVDGAHIDAYGDAHADEGFCMAIRKAEVQGEIVENRFKASWFKIVESPNAPR